MQNIVPFKRTMLASLLTLAASAASSAYAAPATTTAPENAPKQNTSKPNIVVIFGDDIGYWNLSTYNQGTMGYKTPNIDSIAQKELSLPPIMLSKAQLLVVLHLLPARCRFVPG